MVPDKADFDWESNQALDDIKHYDRTVYDKPETEDLLDPTQGRMSLVPIKKLEKLLKMYGFLIC